MLPAGHALILGKGLEAGLNTSWRCLPLTQDRENMSLRLVKFSQCSKQDKVTGFQFKFLHVSKGSQMMWFYDNVTQDTAAMRIS